MQRVLSATLLMLTIFGAANAQCGSNALLTTEMIARFGGSANVLTTPITLSASTAMCGFLANQSVCISEAGFTYFKTYLENFKSNFTASSEARDKQRFSNVGAQLNSQNQSDTRTQNVIQIGQIFNQTIINFNKSGASQPYDFGNFLGKVSSQGFNKYIAPNEGQAKKQNELQVKDNQKRGKPVCQGVDNSTTSTVEVSGGTKCGGQGKGQGQGSQTAQGQQQQNQSGQNQSSGQKLRNLQQNSAEVGSGPIGGSQGAKNGVSKSGSSQRDGVPMDTQGWGALQKNLGLAKAKCGVAVMKQYYYATCLSALVSSATNSTVSGDSSNPKVQISNSACQGYKSKCTDYMTFAQQAENVKSNVDSANSIWAMNIYTITSNTTLSESEKSTQLNEYATIVLQSMNTAQGNQAQRPWQPISCNSTNNDSSDCNYICSKVITATGFNQDNFNLVSSTTEGSVASSRNLASSGSVILNSGNTGINPDAAIADTNSAVVVSVQSTPDTSSARALVASLAIIMSIVALF